MSHLFFPPTIYDDSDTDEGEGDNKRVTGHSSSDDDEEEGAKFKAGALQLSLGKDLSEISDNIRDKKKPSKKAAAQQREKDKFFDVASSDAVVASSTNKAAKSSSFFMDLNLSRPMLRAISDCGFVEPTPIQKACIPVALAGRDICACSATGTGKTAAFMLPILERMLFKPRGRTITRALILVPTRELAIQVFQVSKRMAKYCNVVEICLCAGGSHSYGSIIKGKCQHPQMAQMGSDE